MGKVTVLYMHTPSHNNLDDHYNGIVDMIPEDIIEQYENGVLCKAVLAYLHYTYLSCLGVQHHICHYLYWVHCNTQHSSLGYLVFTPLGGMKY